MDEREPRRVHIHIELGRGHLVALLALLALGAFAIALNSETLVMTTSYPAPSGVYQTLITRAQTILARDTASNGSRVGVGTAAPGSLLDVNGTAHLRGSPGGTGLVVNAAGNVGVGTAAPGSLLDVNGGLNVNGPAQLRGSPGLAGLVVNGVGQVGAGMAPGMQLDVPQNTGIRLGQAYLSSGGNYAHLATNEWYNGGAWQTNGNAGLLYQQIDYRYHEWYYHDAAGNHAWLMGLDNGGNLSNAGIGNFTDVWLRNVGKWASQVGGAAAYSVGLGTLGAYHGGCPPSWCSVACVAACNRWCLYAMGYVGGTMVECNNVADECICFH